MSRPTRFEHNRYVGDKRKQVVYDLDLADSDPEVAAAVEELLASERFAAFGPDTLAEARNRGYRPHQSIRRARGRGRRRGRERVVRAARDRRPRSPVDAGVRRRRDGRLRSRVRGVLPHDAAAPRRATRWPTCSAPPTCSACCSRGTRRPTPGCRPSPTTSSPAAPATIPTRSSGSRRSTRCKGDAAVAELERAVRELGLRGLKLHPTAQGFRPDDRAVYPIYETAAALGIPVTRPHRHDRVSARGCRAAGS